MLDLRARHYDPNTGRFLSADTVQPNAPGSQGFNRYAYVANNPMRYTDPTGHTISDIEEGIEILTQLTAALVAVGALIQATLPLMLLPFLGLALALFFFMLILSIVAAMFMVIGQILELLLDQFDHYQGDAPNDPNSPNDPDDLPEDPSSDPCGIDSMPSGSSEFLLGAASAEPSQWIAMCLGDRMNEAFGPPYDLTKILQILDIIPIEELCTLSAPAAQPYCALAETIVGAGAFTASEWQIENSGCDQTTKDIAGGLNTANFLTDAPLPGLFEELFEVGLYLTSNELLKC